MVEIANDVEAAQDSRIYIERVNAPFLAAGGTRDDFRAGIDRAVALGWLRQHESGTYVKFTDSGAALFAWEAPVTDESLHLLPEGRRAAAVDKLRWVNLGSAQSRTSNREHSDDWENGDISGNGRGRG